MIEGPSEAPVRGAQGRAVAATVPKDTVTATMDGARATACDATAVLAKSFT